MSFSVTMPALGESVTEGTVTRWLKNEGDVVAVDEPLLEVSTDKVDTEIPSPAAGVLQKIVVGPDQTVAVGAELAIISADVSAPSSNVNVAQVPPVAATPEPVAVTPTPAPVAAAIHPGHSPPWMTKRAAAASMSRHTGNRQTPLGKRRARRRGSALEMSNAAETEGSRRSDAAMSR